MNTCSIFYLHTQDAIQLEKWREIVGRETLPIISEQSTYGVTNDGQGAHFYRLDPSRLTVLERCRVALYINKHSSLSYPEAHDTVCENGWLIDGTHCVVIIGDTNYSSLVV